LSGKESEEDLIRDSISPLSIESREKEREGRGEEGGGRSSLFFSSFYPLEKRAEDLLAQVSQRRERKGKKERGRGWTSLLTLWERKGDAYDEPQHRRREYERGKGGKKEETGPWNSSQFHDTYMEEIKEGKREEKERRYGLDYAMSVSRNGKKRGGPLGNTL